MGTRIAVDDVLEHLASGMAPDEVVADLPEPTQAHIRAALELAARRESDDEEVSPASATLAQPVAILSLLRPSRITCGRVVPRSRPGRAAGSIDTTRTTMAFELPRTPTTSTSWPRTLWERGPGMTTTEAVETWGDRFLHAESALDAILDRRQPDPTALDEAVRACLDAGLAAAFYGPDAPLAPG